MFYKQLIAKAIKVTDPIAIANVEENMRMNLTGLSHLEKRAFNRLAREAAATCVALGAIAAADYLVSLVEA